MKAKSIIEQLVEGTVTDVVEINEHVICVMGTNLKVQGLPTCAVDINYTAGTLKTYDTQDDHFNSNVTRTFHIKATLE